MERYLFEAKVAADGTLLLDDLPFEPGDSVQIALVKQVADTEPFLSPDRPQTWENANPAYWIRIASERISKEFSPEKIVLFGSQATGTATVNSDIDLLIIFKAIEDKHERAVAIRRLLSDFLMSVDVVVATEQDIEKYGKSIGRVYKPALEEGILIYEREEPYVGCAGMAGASAR
ncbi:nucleotidyltransferase domain-containing protein [cf. Phormidesmis sp. LEGE 11477]|uniref:nucleotidyltransferase domain-containing protein n=1 Tax=cf. Phormidesmis sp. LEGE 11477 TaxID=1828680 RepID=UPI001882AA92|nr:nucleotidyltransferase domain-containing protein [cf. Phormidesmis sp. LEGE 11477]MBE9064646.1 nucleotidyltransferase domain-containing protein [cf. Phormidesmis sp. LEGE 11477]